MSDEGRPLSRRERRALEQRQAAGDADPTEALPTAPTSDGARLLSRREQRRLERMSRPVETWTAEEEMIATGQFPALTPEAIAEQDTLARERAEAADADAADAEAAGAEARDASAEGGFTPPEPDAGAPVPERVSTFVNMPADHDQESPGEDVTPPADEDSEPAADEFAAPDDVATVPSEGVLPEPGLLPSPASDSGALDNGDRPDAEVSEPEAEGGEEIPEAFRGMFPPGSLQATALAARSREPHTVAGLGQPPFPVGGSPDGADEIRRLTEEAMANLNRMGPAYTPEMQTGGSPVVAGEEVSDELPASDESAEHDDMPVADESAEHDDMPAAPAVEDTSSDDDTAIDDVPAMPAGVDFAELWRSDDAHDGDAHDPESQPFELQEVPFVGDVHRPGDDEDGTADAAPAWDTLVATAVSSSGKPAFDPVNPAAAPKSAATVWDTHPLTGTSQFTPARELEDPSPSAELPRPDLSALLRDPVSDQAVAAAAAYQATEPATTTGSTPIERRVPELQPAGGARHFRWAHLAVIGAIAFVLGVLVWNIVRSNS